jgi:hypothetical protein
MLVRSEVFDVSNAVQCDFNPGAGIDVSNAFSAAFNRPITAFELNVSFIHMFVTLWPPFKPKPGFPGWFCLILSVIFDDLPHVSRICKNYLKKLLNPKTEVNNFPAKAPLMKAAAQRACG